MTWVITVLSEADAYLFASPIYNWGVPSQLKAWFDHVMLGRSLSGATPALAGRPGVLVMAKGGAYGRARAGTMPSRGCGACSST
jgi:FMN-dependent NADH-azoreductase